MGRGKSGRAGLIAALLAVLLIAIVVQDVVGARPSFGARMAVFAIDRYRAHISPLLAGRVRCRFKPTCSAYGRATIQKHGLISGGAKTVARIARCGPWTPAGTVDLP